MKTTTALFLALLLGGSASAMDDLRLTVQGNNVILSWPSAGYEVFVVRHRPDLQSGSAWTILADNYAATPGTNRTSLTQVGGFIPAPPCPGGGGGGGSPPVPEGGLRVPAIEGPVVATTELAAYVEGERPRKPAAQRTRTPIIGLPPSPKPMWSMFTPGEQERQAQMAAVAEAAVSESGPLDSDGACPVGMGLYQVLLVPDTWFNYSQHQFTEGWEFLPVYLGVDGDMVAQMELLVDGQPFPHVEFALEWYDFGTPQNPDWGWTYGLWVNHDRMANGVHQFRVRTTLHLSSAPSDLSDDLTMTAPAFTSTVNNPISFATWNDNITGNSHVFRATTTSFPADWQIDVYDATENWVQSATGYTANGEIVWTWDLRDSTGALRNDLDFDPYFDPRVTITPTGGGGGSPPRPAPISTIDYPSLASWLFAYQDSDKRTPEIRSSISTAIGTLPGGPSFHGVPSHSVTLAYGNDVDPDPATAQTIRNNSWIPFATYLFDPQYKHRNLYYMGHGAERWIGGDYDIETGGVIVGSQQAPGSHAYMPSSAVQVGLTYNSQSGPRRLRFIFLDGCASARGDFPSSFGIGKETNSLAIYLDPTKNIYNWRPSAFVGWQEPIGYCVILGQTAGGEWGDYVKYANFRTTWMFNWSQNAQTDELFEALDNARITSNWINLSTYERVIRVFGYRNLKFNEFNRRSDWPMP